MIVITVSFDINITGKGCYLRILAVGGGGSGGCGCPSGGGSGFIKYLELPVDEYHDGLYVKLGVGQGAHIKTVHRGFVRIPAQASNFSVYPDYTCNINPSECWSYNYTARAGQDCFYDNQERRHHGGDGYSGGGGYCGDEPCPFKLDGGSNGSSGPQPSTRLGVFGIGTGENVSLYKMDNFAIAPGKGGEEYLNAPGSWRVSGGGGGVVVDGIVDTTKPSSGQGYGGGEGNCEGAQPGVILVEIGKKL